MHGGPIHTPGFRWARHGLWHLTAQGRSRVSSCSPPARPQRGPDASTGNGTSEKFVNPSALSPWVADDGRRLVIRPDHVRCAALHAPGHLRSARLE
jgi:hypothetical protein